MPGSISPKLWLFCRVCAGPLFMLLIKAMLPKVAKPFATPFTVVWCATPFTVVWCATVVAASVAVPCLTFFSFRLARVDFALTSPEVETNMCGTGEDTITTKEMRQRKHPFSSIDPIYDILVAGVKHVLFLNTTILTRLLCRSCVASRWCQALPFSMPSSSMSSTSTTSRQLQYE